MWGCVGSALMISFLSTVTPVFLSADSPTAVERTDAGGFGTHTHTLSCTKVSADAPGFGQTLWQTHWNEPGANLLETASTERMHCAWESAVYFGQCPSWHPRFAATYWTKGARPKTENTKACWDLRFPWFPNRKSTSHLHRLTNFRVWGFRFPRKPLMESLPMTVFLAPVSKIPHVSRVANSTLALLPDSGCMWLSADWHFLCSNVSFGYPDASLRRLSHDLRKILRTFPTSCRGCWRCAASVLCMTDELSELVLRLPLALTLFLIRSLTSISFTQVCEGWHGFWKDLQETACTKQNSLAWVSWVGGFSVTTGKLMNSEGMANSSISADKPIDKVMGAAAPGVDPEDCPLLGHSLFQWPFFPQILQLLSRVLLLKTFSESPSLLSFSLVFWSPCLCLWRSARNLWISPFRSIFSLLQHTRNMLQLSPHRLGRCQPLLSRSQKQRLHHHPPLAPMFPSIHLHSIHHVVSCELNHHVLHVCPCLQ